MNAIELLAAKAVQTSAGGYFHAEGGEPVPSPCISVCRMTEDRSHCQGCFRTLDEIRVWSKADAPQRRAIWQAALLRAGIALPEAAPSPSLLDCQEVSP